MKRQVNTPAPALDLPKEILMKVVEDQFRPPSVKVTMMTILTGHRLQLNENPSGLSHRLRCYAALNSSSNGFGLASAAVSATTSS